MTVMYLTLLSDCPRRRDTDRFSVEERTEWAELVHAAEVVALCRTRDAMGKGLAPMMGMLRYVPFICFDHLLTKPQTTPTPACCRRPPTLSPLRFVSCNWSASN